MDGVVPRAHVEKMGYKQVQQLYQEVQEAWSFGDLRRYHHKAGKEKLIEQLDAAGYWGPKISGPKLKRKDTDTASAAPAGKKVKGPEPEPEHVMMPPPSGTNLVNLRAKVAEVKSDTQNVALLSKLNALDTGAHSKIALMEQAKGQAGGFGKSASRAGKEYEQVVMGKEVIEAGIKGILGEIKSELPSELHGLVDIVRGRYNDTNIVRHGHPRETGWDGAKISGNGVVKTRRFMPYAPAKSPEEAQANVVFQEAFLKVLPADVEAAAKTGLPLDTEQSRIGRVDMLQMRLALINCNSTYLKLEMDEAEKKLKDNKNKIDALSKEIHDTLEEVEEAIKAAKLVGVGGASSHSSSRSAIFRSASDETDNATLSMVDSDDGSGEEY